MSIQGLYVMKISIKSRFLALLYFWYCYIQNNSLSSQAWKKWCWTQMVRKLAVRKQQGRKYLGTSYQQFSWIYLANKQKCESSPCLKMLILWSIIFTTENRILLCLLTLHPRVIANRNDYWNIWRWYIDISKFIKAHLQLLNSI